MDIIPSNPKISVVIFSYNFEKYIGECIDSVLSQTLQPFEIIICDDHSTDNTHSILSKYARKYPALIKVHIQEKNIGIALNADFGIRQPHGDLLSWMDGDDRWLPRKLELEWKALCENPEARVAYSNVYSINAYGKRIGVWADEKSPPPPSGDVFIQVFSKNFFPGINNVFRNALFYRSCYDEIGYYDTSLESFWDWDEKIRLTWKFQVAYSGEALIEYRSHPGGFSHNYTDIHLKAMLKIYEKHAHLLEHRTQEEQFEVKYKIESLIAIRQSRKSAQYFNEKYSLPNVFLRNRKLLVKLSNEARSRIGKANIQLFEDVECGVLSEVLSACRMRTIIKECAKKFFRRRK